MNNLFLGIFYSILGQVGTFLQLQGNVKYGWYEKYPLLMLLSGIPIGYLYIKSVTYFVKQFGGEIWPSRLLGFGVGIIIFSLMSYFLFREPLTPKTIICLFLASIIIAIQIFMK
jgi:predicted MFS family arabinose efflux permease